MKYKIAILVMLMSFLTLPVFAQTTSTAELSKAGLKPGDFLYVFDRIAEKIDLFLTFNLAKRAEKALKFSDEKLSEMREIIAAKEVKLQERKTEFLEKAEQYRLEYEKRAEEYVGKIKGANDEAKRVVEQLEERKRERSEEAIQKTDEQLDALKARIEEHYELHKENMERVLENAPESAKPALEKVMEAAQQRFEQRVEDIESDNGAKVQNQVQNQGAEQQVTEEEKEQSGTVQKKANGQK